MTAKQEAILAATDFSPHARHALERAALVAQRQAARLALLHVLPAHAIAQMRAWLGVGTPVERGLRDEAAERLDVQARRLQATAGGAVEVRLEEGPVLATTLQQAEALDARLVVLGARGAGHLRRLTLGTTAERLMRHSSRPILVARGAPHEPYRRVLVAADFSPWSAAALDIARWVAPDARLVLASVVQVPFESRMRLAGVSDADIGRYRERARSEATGRLQALADAAQLPAGQWQPVVGEGDPAYALLEMEQEHDCDLVVLGKHGSGQAVDFLLGSVTQTVLSESSGDVLISTRGA